MLLIITAFHSRSLHLPSLQTSAIIIRNPKTKWHEDSFSGLFQFEHLSVPHTLSSFSPAVISKTRIKKCKSTIKSTYCKTHALANDLGIYIVLEPTFAFSLWTILVFKSMGPFNMQSFNANVPACQHLVACPCNTGSQECGCANICYLTASQVLTFMTYLHLPAWFLSEIKIFKWRTCTYTTIILDDHSLP